MARILIIDDDDGVRKILRLMLESGGYEVDDAPDGYEGVKRFREKSPDLVITDIVMAGDLVAPGYYLNMVKNFDAVHEMQKPIGREELLDTVKALL